MVTAPEAVALLAFASDFDNRGPNPENVRAWSTVLADLDFQACREAIEAHYASEHRWVMPSDVRKRVEMSHVEVSGLDLVAMLDELEPPEWLASMDDGPEFNTAWVQWRKEQARRIRAGEPLDVGPEPVLVARPVRALVS